MSENERRNGSTPGGHVPYISMARQNNFGGFRNMESTFWPEPNPLLRRDLRGKPDMQYAFERIARCVSVEEAGPALQEARYVVATLDINDATLEEGPYHGYFKALRDAAPLEMIDFFMTPAYGLLPAGMVAVFYRGAPDPIAGIADLRGNEAASDPAALAFNAMDLLSVLQRDAVAPVLNDAQRADCNARASAILPLLQNQMAISPNIDLARIAIDQPYSGWYRLRMLFHVKAQPSNNWRMYVSGSFGAEVAHLVPEKVRTQKYFSWNFDPDRPTSTWRPGDYVLCTKEFACPPILLKNISIGFVKNNEMQGQMINTGEIDFAAIPVNERPPLADATTTK
jgi:hypothetical protein